MPQPVTSPRRRPLSAPEDAESRQAVQRWEATQPRDENKRPVTFNSSF